MVDVKRGRGRGRGRARSQVSGSRGRGKSKEESETDSESDVEVETDEDEKEIQRQKTPQRSLTKKKAKQDQSTPSRSSLVTVNLSSGNISFRSPMKSPFQMKVGKFASPNHNNRVRALRTREELEAMALQCIKLSQTGKISEKNAWDLNLTSHLHDVITQPTEDKKTNFQVSFNYFL
jgi:hypothetical protein